MSQARFLEQQLEVQKAATRLGEAAAEPETSIVRDAVIQRFEFSFELIWKTLQHYLEHQGHQCGGPRATLKKAFMEAIIPSAEEADIWMGMLEDRNLTSHAYDEVLALRISEHVVRRYHPLIAAMTQRIQSLNWE